MRLSKSRYVTGLQCPKILWMNEHMPEQFDESVRDEVLLEVGNAVGDLAMGYYGDYVEVEFDEHGFQAMAERTRELLDAGERVICEATFIYEDNFCMADILRVDDDGVHIVEVKATNSLKDYHQDDASYQLWVIEQCGLKVKSVGLMYLNGNYRRKGDIDLHELFVVEDITEEARYRAQSVPMNIQQIVKKADVDDEPIVRMGRHCKNPHPCGYQEWCKREFPRPCVFDINSIWMSVAADMAYDDGIVTFEDVLENGVLLNPRQSVQVACEVNGADEYVDREAVRSFLDRLRFPLYFLDFETFREAIPPFDGCWPYEQIPSQYSLHVLDEPGGTLSHYEFLAPEGSDPRRAVAEHLCADIPMGACSIAFNMSFERTRIREMAELFPDLAAHLEDINAGMVDLIEPFKTGSYYRRAMGKSNSIKAVLPALFPDDPELDYRALEGVHNGGEAMNAYANLTKLPEEERAVVREQLLRYCELDTLAMVRIYEKLLDSVQ